MTRSRGSKAGLKSEPSSGPATPNPPGGNAPWGQGNSKNARKRRQKRLAHGITEQVEPSSKRQCKQSGGDGPSTAPRHPLAELSSASSWQPVQPSHNDYAGMRDKGPSQFLSASVRPPGVSKGRGAASWQLQSIVELPSATKTKLLVTPDELTSQRQKINFVNPTEAKHDQTPHILAAINALFWDRCEEANGVAQRDESAAKHKKDPRLGVIDLTRDDAPPQREGTDQFEAVQYSKLPSAHGHKRKRSPSNEGPPTFPFSQISHGVFGFDIAVQTISGVARGTLFDPNQQTETISTALQLPKPDSFQSTVKFGQPQKPLPGLDRVVWVQQNPENLADGEVDLEESLETLYNEYPEKRLCSIEPETLRLVARTVQQISYEAAGDWLKSSCPGTHWDDDLINVEGLYDFDAPRLDHTIVDRALSAQSTKRTITLLLATSRTTIQATRTMTLSDLIRMTDQSIAVCHVANDEKRLLLLREAKEKVAWLPVGLDCKKLDIQRRALDNLDGFYQQFRKVKTSGAEGNTGQIEGQIAILDRALVEFQEYRLEFVIDMFATLKRLLEAAA